MLFSVVICTFNRADMVGRAIRSVLAQTFEGFELIVVDDGSTDETPSMIASFEDRRMRIIRRLNGGLSAARNTGIAAASGRYVTFLDDDDRADPGWLESLAAAHGPQTGFLSCTCRMVTPDGEPVGNRPASPHPVYPQIRGVFLAGTFAVDRTVLETIGGYDEKIPVNHQTELMLRVLPELGRRGMQAVLVDEPLVSIEQRDHTSRPLRNPSALLAGTEYLIDRHRTALRRSPATLADYHAVAGVNAVRLGRLGTARRHFWAAVRTRPYSLRHAGRLAISLASPVARRAWPSVGASGARTPSVTGGAGAS